MKKIFRILVLALVMSSIAGITSSCAVFNETSHAQSVKTFKHKKTLPKKYIVDNGNKQIAK
jgi:hypothetical protein